MVVMKFGGSSVADAKRIASVIDIAAARFTEERVCLVFSAMKGITDLLLAAASSAESGNDSHEAALADIRTRHHEALQQLCPDDADARATIDRILTELGELLHGVRLVRECTPRTSDLIVGIGERLSCRLITAALRARGLPARYVDAREMVVTDDNHGLATVFFEESYQRIHAALAGDDLPVVTGFIAATESGVSTTLGRNGSDYTASIVGAGIRADLIEIWTDVDGVYSADPRFVEQAFVLPEISYQEAMELSYFGAKVIHPYTMVPAVDRSIPLRIRNTLRPAAPGTLIAAHTSSRSESITGIASIESVALLNVEGGGMVGLPGVAGRIFTALASARINIIMISQASSEHSICFVVPDDDALRAARLLEQELDAELRRKRIERVAVQRELEIVAVIGENMRGKPGISGRLFHSLGEEQINVLAIAQGSSEMNISFIVPASERERTILTVHDAFFGEGV
jgi:aspartokinase/homoserine dehydrogenase 1